MKRATTRTGKSGGGRKTNGDRQKKFPCKKNRGLAEYATKRRGLVRNGPYLIAEGGEQERKVEAGGKVKPRKKTNEKKKKNGWHKNSEASSTSRRKRLSFKRKLALP